MTHYSCPNGIRIKNPWAFDFLPSGEILITERGGTLLLIDENRSHTGTGERRTAAARAQLDGYNLRDVKVI